MRVNAVATRKTLRHTKPARGLTPPRTGNRSSSTSGGTTASVGNKNSPTSGRAKRAARRSALEAAALLRNKAYERMRGGARAVLPIRDGCVMVVSDQHYVPGLPESRAHRASVKMAKLLKPYAIISNGDAIDGASISRWPVSSFVEMTGRPTVAAEIGVTVKRLGDYEDLDFVEFLVWNLGNHDARFETRLAEKVPEYRGVDGFTLKEHFPFWLPAWRTDLATRPGDAPQVIVKHRFKGGMHAGQNNVLWSGTSSVTGHDHMLKAYALTNVHGLQWGVHAGTVAPVDSPLFTHYTEDNVVNWQEGFVFLHFQGGRFVGPELIHVTPDGATLFRGKVLR